MVKVYLVLTGFITLISPVCAQFCELEMAQVLYEDKLQDAVRMEVDIPKADFKDAFNDFVNKELNANLKGYGFLTRKDEVHTEMQTLSSISPNPVKLVGLFQESAGRTLLFLIGQVENGDFLTENNDSLTFSSLLRFSNDFLQFYLPVYYNHLVTEANERFEDATAELEKREKDIKKDEEEIIRLKEEILKLENEILEAQEEVSTLQADVAESRETVVEKRDRLRAALDALNQIKY